MLTDKNINLRAIKNIHSKKSSILRQLIIQLNKSKPKLFSLFLKLLECLKTKAISFLNILKTLKKFQANVLSKTHFC